MHSVLPAIGRFSAYDVTVQPGSQVLLKVMASGFFSASSLLKVSRYEQPIMKDSQGYQVL